MTKEKLKEIRKKMGMTQGEFGVLIGYKNASSAKVSVCRIETGARGISGQVTAAVHREKLLFDIKNSC